MLCRELRVPSLRSAFRLRAQTPAEPLNLDFVGVAKTAPGMRRVGFCTVSCCAVVWLRHEISRGSMPKSSPGKSTGFSPDLSESDSQQTAYSYSGHKRILKRCGEPRLEYRNGFAQKGTRGRALCAATSAGGK